jgi:Ca-activated chloride channel homolog
MSFAAPAWLLALLALPVLASGLVAWARRGRRVAREYADPRVLAVGPGRRARVRRTAAAALALAAVGAGTLALARPTVDAEDRERRSTVLVVLDVSRSMLADDLRPSRLEAALAAAERLVDRAPDDAAIGLVTFADRARVVVAPERDRARLRAALDAPEPTRVGTALGEAVVTGLGALAANGALDPPPASAADSPARMLILTDGANSIRRALTPVAAARRAAEARVPLYPILLGDDPGRRGDASPAETLAAMASITGGVSAQSTTTADLSRVLADIGASVVPVERRRELTVLAAALTLVLLAAAALLATLARPAPPRGGAPQPSR